MSNEVLGRIEISVNHNIRSFCESTLSDPSKDWLPRLPCQVIDHHDHPAVHILQSCDVLIYREVTNAIADEGWNIFVSLYAYREWKSQSRMMHKTTRIMMEVLASYGVVLTTIGD